MKPSIRILCLVTLGMVFMGGCARIKPDEIGVRTVNVGPNKGIAARDYGPGLYRAVWPLDTWHKFPRTVQTLPFLKESLPQADSSSSPLLLTSADGDRVLLDAEVFFRIAEDQAHRVLQDSGAGEKYKDVVRSSVIDAGRAAFGQLKTEDFYNPQQRESARLQALGLLKERLTPRGIEMIDFLVESIAFTPEYEKLIKQKKVSDQMVLLEVSKAKAAEEKGKVDKIRAETLAKLQKIQRENEAEILHLNTETDMRIAALKAQAEQYAAQRQADADLYQSRRVAEGKFLKKSAEAEGAQRMNRALSGEGGNNVTALEAARNLQMNEVVFPSTGLDWFNPMEMARRLGAETILEAAADEPLPEGAP